MKHILQRRIFLLLLLSIATTSAIAATQGGTFATGRVGNVNGFFSIDSATGRASLIASTTEAILGIDFNDDGVLYGSNDRLFSIDTTTGVQTLIGTLPETISDIAFEPTTNRLYGVGGRAIYELNPATGSILGSHFCEERRCDSTIVFLADGTLLNRRGTVIDPTTGDIVPGGRHLNFPGGQGSATLATTVDPAGNDVVLEFRGSIQPHLRAFFTSDGSVIDLGPTALTPPRLVFFGLASNEMLARATGPVPVPVPAAIYFVIPSALFLFGFRRERCAFRR